MKKSLIMVVALGLTMFLSGCPIWIETERVDGPDCDWGCSVGCASDLDCVDGYICNSQGACVPESVGPVICTSDAQCENGYCDIPVQDAAGVCVETGPCVLPEDCSSYGVGLTCDDRGVCVPDEGPCPDGVCGCLDDSECADGSLCIESLCTDPSTICFFDFECGEEGICVDNACRMLCLEADGQVDCPVGQGCTAGVCGDLVVGLDGCVFDEDCGLDGGFSCINATCHPTCGTPEECGAGEACSSGVCRADTRPLHECSIDGGECVDGMACLRGVCRMPCAASVNCANQGDMTECLDGFCHTLSEANAVCSRADDCEGDAVCHDGQCATLQ